MKITIYKIYVTLSPLFHSTILWFMYLSPSKLHKALWKMCTVESYMYFWQHFTQVLSLYFIKNFLILWDWQFYPTVYVYITSRYTDLSCIYFLYIQYIHFSTTYLFLMKQECQILGTIVFGMVHSQRPVVVLLHKHLSSDIALYLILSALSQIVQHTVAQFVQTALHVGCRFNSRWCH
jgi:hypothetical protein